MREGGRKEGSVSGENVGKKDGSDRSRARVRRGRDNRLGWWVGVCRVGCCYWLHHHQQQHHLQGGRGSLHCHAGPRSSQRPLDKAEADVTFFNTLLSVCDVSSGRPSPSPEPSLPPLSCPPPHLSTHKNQRQPVCKAFQASRTSCVLISANYGALLQPMLVVFNESQTIVKVWPEQREKKVCFFFVCFI